MSKNTIQLKIGEIHDLRDSLIVALAQKDWELVTALKEEIKEIKEELDNHGVKYTLKG